MDRMELNMRIEAKQYVWDGIVLPQCTHQSRADRRDVYVREEIAKYEAQHGIKWEFKSHKTRTSIPWTTAQRDGIRLSMIKQLHKLAGKYNLSTAEEQQWLDDAESLYEIDSTFQVNSFAKVRGENKSWQYQTSAAAEAKIGKLIAYKINDRLYKNVGLDVDTSNVHQVSFVH